MRGRRVESTLVLIEFTLVNPHLNGSRGLPSPNSGFRLNLLILRSTFKLDKEMDPVRVQPIHIISSSGRF